MSEPTLEQIVKEGWLRRYASGLPCYTQDLESTIELLATETLELRNRVNRLDAQARAYQEDGALAAGRGAGDDIDWKMTADEWRERHGHVAAERDHAQQVIQRVATERDEAVEARKVWMEACHIAQEKFYGACAQRDTARAALRKIADPLFIADREAIHKIATDALAGGEANEGSGE